MRVSDQRGKTEEVLCSVTVTRNLQSPEFINNPPYSASIPFNQPRFQDFSFPEAIDNDLQGEIVYEITGYDGGAQYFDIQKLEDGRAAVFVKSVFLAQDRTLTYVVC